MEIAECLGLSPDGQYRFQDLFRFAGEGRDAAGKIVGRLRPTGGRPSFAPEVDALGYRDRVKLTADLFPPAGAEPVSPHA